jgi:hypothetical protein
MPLGYPQATQNSMKNFITTKKKRIELLTHLENEKVVGKDEKVRDVFLFSLLIENEEKRKVGPDELRRLSTIYVYMSRNMT